MRDTILIYSVVYGFLFSILWMASDSINRLSKEVFLSRFNPFVISVPAKVKENFLVLLDWQETRNEPEGGFGIGCKLEYAIHGRDYQYMDIRGVNVGESDYFLTDVNEKYFSHLGGDALFKLHINSKPFKVNLKQAETIGSVLGENAIRAVSDALLKSNRGESQVNIQLMEFFPSWVKVQMPDKGQWIMNVLSSLFAGLFVALFVIIFLALKIQFPLNRKWFSPGAKPYVIVDDAFSPNSVLQWSEK